MNPSPPPPPPPPQVPSSTYHPPVEAALIASHRETQRERAQVSETSSFNALVHVYTELAYDTVLIGAKTIMYACSRD